MTVIDLLHQPLYQLILFIGITIMVALFLKGRPTNAFWNVAGLFYIVFIATNAVFIFFVDNTWTYFFISLAISLLYILVIGVVIPFMIKIYRIDGSGESATIFLFIIYHPIILLLMIFLKWILE